MTVRKAKTLLPVTLFLLGYREGEDNMEEVWKAIDGYEGLYEVSNTGKVKSLNYLGHGKVCELKLAKDQKGYLRVNLWKNGKRQTVKVHRVVAKAFIPNPENKAEVNHVNGLKFDNRAENLEWATAKENTIHAYNSGLKEKTREACRKTGKKYAGILDKYRNERKTPVIATNILTGQETLFESQNEAARVLGVPQANVFKVIKRERKSAGGYSFRLADKGGDAHDNA